METKIIKLLDSSLECIDCKIKDDKIILHIYSTKQKLICPYCGNASSKIHSVYQRELQDIPLHEKQTILLLDTRKVYCDNPECSHKTFSERFDFVVPNGKKTKRLVEKILVTSVKLSSVSASSLLKADYVKTSKSSICDLIKKNAFPCG
ncbi:transposase family protein [Lacrimispora sp. BS-2]|uniref:Transposase family protein n=1 Tax=Lacrimispora sp. BS-2 TaxID=3151850 RepID=A0AAU7PU27_9FIRM